jgi:hypothetical protein
MQSAAIRASAGSSFFQLEKRISEKRRLSAIAQIDD